MRNILIVLLGIMFIVSANGANGVWIDCGDDNDPKECSSSVCGCEYSTGGTYIASIKGANFKKPHYKSGWYIPNGKNYRVKCPDDFSKTDNGASSIDDCYRDCVIGDISGCTAGQTAVGKVGYSGESNCSCAGCQYTVNLHLNGGILPSGYDNQAILNVGDIYNEPIPQEREGYTFMGWYRSQNFLSGEKQTFPITAGTTPGFTLCDFNTMDLYALWLLDSVTTVTTEFLGQKVSLDIQKQY